MVLSKIGLAQRRVIRSLIVGLIAAGCGDNASNVVAGRGGAAGIGRSDGTGGTNVDSGIGGMGQTADAGSQGAGGEMGAGGKPHSGTGGTAGAPGQAGTGGAPLQCVDTVQPARCTPNVGGDGLCQNGTCESVPDRFSEGLSKEADDGIASAPDVTLVPEGIMLSDGTSLADWTRSQAPQGSGLDDLRTQAGVDAKDVIARMQSCFLDIIHNPPAFSAGMAPNEPDQTRYVYVWGSRDLMTRKAGTERLGCCTDKLFGTDCSGLVLICAWKAGILFPDVGANGLRSLSEWNGQLPDGIKAVQIEVDGSARSYETGDLVFWNEVATSGKAGHVGVLDQFGATSAPFVLQSNGRDGCSDPPAQCANNRSPGRGPRTVGWNDINRWFVNGRQFEAVRFVNEVEHAVVAQGGTAGPLGAVQVSADGVPLLGTCVSSPAGVQCDTSFNTESSIDLLAIAPASAGVTFTGWLGRDCAGAGNTTRLTFSKRLKRIECTATFACANAGVACGGTCVDPICTGGRTFDAQSCGCQCPAGQRFCNGTCMSTTCTGGQTFDDSTCTCACASGTTVCGGTCAASCDAPPSIGISSFSVTACSYNSSTRAGSVTLVARGSFTPVGATVTASATEREISGIAPGFTGAPVSISGNGGAWSVDGFTISYTKTRYVYVVGLTVTASNSAGSSSAYYEAGCIP